MNALLVASIFFWFFHAQHRIFYYLFLWQSKSYRIDRFLDEVDRNRGILIPRISLIALALLVLSGIFKEYFVGYVFVFYLTFGFRSLISFFRRNWRFPKPTKKIIVLLFFTWAFLAFLFFLFYSSVLKFILALEILFPLFVFFSLQLVQIPTFFAKMYVFWKAAKKREEVNGLQVVGITGSFGKSSTKEFLFTILSEKYRVLKTEGNVNTEMGVANTVLSKLKSDHQVFICEMGAYKRGEIKKICQIVKPKIGILTGINQQHLSLFKSQENIIKAKYELIESLPEDGAAFFNERNKYCLDLYEKTKVRKILYGKEAAFLGEENLLGAIAVAKELGMSEKDILIGVSKIKNKLSGIEVKQGIGGLKIIDATYSANPDGVIAHLEYLNDFPGKKVVVMPCLIELGKSSKEVHLEIGKKIAEVCDLAIITTNNCFSYIKETGGEKVFLIRDSKGIFEKIKSSIGNKGTVLLEGRESMAPNRLLKMLVL